jgi:hypothetical protein
MAVPLLSRILAQTGLQFFIPFRRSNMLPCHSGAIQARGVREEIVLSDLQDNSRRRKIEGARVNIGHEFGCNFKEARP